MKTKTYDIIHLPDGYMYAVDKEAKIEQNNWFIDYEFTCNGKITPLQLLKKYENKQGGEDKTGYISEAKLNSCKKIIASTDTTLNLPLLPEIEENIEQLAEKEFLYSDFIPHNKLTELIKNNNINAINNKRRLCIKGYKAASTKKYTEEDIIKAIRFGELYQKDSAKSLFEKKGIKPTEAVHNFIKSLTPKPISVELEMESIFQDIWIGEMNVPTHQGFQVKIVNNIVQVKRWIY